MLFKRARGKCIRGGILNQIEHRHRYAAADREVLERVVELGCIFFFYLFRMRHHEHGVFTECERNEDVEAGEEEGGSDKEKGISRLYFAKDHRNRGEKEYESDHEENRGEAITGEMRVDHGQNFTATFSLCPASSISKKSCFPNFLPKNPTITLFGNTSIFVLKSRTIPLKNRREA